MTHSSNRPVISVVICTRNSSDRIQETLESIHCQSLSQDRYEVLVIDNASDDDTYPWLTNNTERYGYRLLQEPELGLSAARNKGIKEAKGEYIFFTDDDAVAPAHLLATFASDIQADHPEVLGGPVHGLWEHTPPKWLHSGYWRSLSLISWGVKRRFLSYPEILIGCNVAIKKDLFDQYGLFDHKLGRKGTNLIGNEERELEKRIVAAGGTVLYNPDAYVFHKVPKARMEIAYFKKRNRDGAYSALAMAEISGNEPTPDSQPNGSIVQGNWLSMTWENKIKPPLKVPYRAFNKGINFLFPVQLRALRVRTGILRGILGHAFKVYNIEISIYQSSLEGRELFFREKNRKG
jgi:glycosyltransferase involved in cell wall biosynthesis